MPSVMRTALVLGLLSAVGPFAIDMYLPALPTIAEHLGTGTAQVQATLMAYFLSFGVAQLAWGPLTDRLGRRVPLLLGLGLFLLASLGCAMAPSIGWLIFFRAVQGLGSSVAMVVPRAVIRDLHTGPAATRLMAMVMLVISVSPMLAPLAGSGLIALFGWRSIFVALALATGLSLALTQFALGETLAPEKRQPIEARRLLRHGRELLMDAKFLGLTFIGGFGMASFFVFIAGAPFVYTESFGLGPTGFSLAFAVNAIGFFAASQMAAPLGERFGPPMVVRAGVLVFAGFALLLTTLALVAPPGLAVVMACLFCANAGLGVVIPTTMVMALDDHGETAGLASSLGGTLQMVSGGVMIALTGPFFDATVLPMAAGIAVCALISLGLTQLTLPRRRAWS